MRIFLMALLLAACGGGGGSDPIPCTMSVEGDSIIDSPGIDVRPLQRLATLRTKWTIEDRGVGGLNMDNLMKGYERPYPEAQISRLGPQLPFKDAKRTAHYIVIELGANDALREGSPEVYEGQLRQAVAIIKAEGREPVITGLVKIPAADTFQEKHVLIRDKMNEKAKTVSTELGITFADFDSVPFAGLTDTIDTIHRTQEASDRVAQRLAETMDKIAPQCRSIQ